MIAVAVRPRSSSFLDSRLVTIAIVVVFWLFQLASLTAQRALMKQDDGFYILLPRLLMTTFGVLSSLVIARITTALAGKPLPRRLGVTVLLAATAAFSHSLVNLGVFQFFLGELAAKNATLSSYASAYVAWFWNYCSIASILLVLSYARDLGRRERDVQELQGLADSAQLTALRYQLNPHFLFNTLNSIVSLIGMGSGKAAETMVEDLSDYYRAMLDMNMGDEVPLAQEIEMQRLYLGIESTRFGDRIDVRFDVADNCRDLKVPSLILQPLVENAIKHGVARRQDRTVLTISAHREGRVRIAVSNDAPIAAGRVAGAGIGLANVARRLQLFYGDDCAFSARLDPVSGLFRVTFLIPDRSS